MRMYLLPCPFFYRKGADRNDLIMTIYNFRNRGGKIKTIQIKTLYHHKSSIVSSSKKILDIAGRTSS